MLQVFPLETLVPWMLAVGPDGALYVSVDQQYEAASSYGNPQEYNVTGAVIRIELLADGEQTTLLSVQQCGSMLSCKRSDKSHREVSLHAKR